jgi:hypothetical protein
MLPHSAPPEALIPSVLSILLSEYCPDNCARPVELDYMLMEIIVLTPALVELILILTKMEELPAEPALVLWD